MSILLQLHNELDAAVAAAYGWPANLTEEEVLEKLVALNRERAAEEARGLVRWLRPEYQNPQGVQQAGLDVKKPEVVTETVNPELTEWPQNLAEQAQAVQRIVQQYQHPVSATELSRQFRKGGKGAKSREQQIEMILQTLNGLGLIRKTEQGGYLK